MTTLLHIIGAVAIIWAVVNLAYVVLVLAKGNYRLQVAPWKVLVIQTAFLVGGLLALGVIG